MKKKIVALLCIVMVFGTMIAGCGSSGDKTQTENTSSEVTTQVSEETPVALADGTYTAEFDTDSKMFQDNPAFEGNGILTVKDGKMTIHIALQSRNIVNLYPGLAKDAQKEGAELLQPVVDTITYDDGSEPEEVNGFDVPVPALDKEFDLALIGTKGKWYDHKV